ncbi:hypothetical protein HKX23_17725 [Sulfitobacter sp. KE29]|uniref:hypothetical protein n=1 Tax=unclassified Sulfitobacter TaxID=196795 RepID=UPI0023E1D209|nr:MULTISPECIES: hypothetical protein [unclassified Sulfitobacter]MDF3420192.1 hypothetical protein [Sulfitobacter sp. Ks38]MDF3427677.1 hypothetical protein [Sulfitobacter sp. KE29]MDF3431256.1 hypothetical protein [Sulfitobacter sp. S46]MDF3446029.1 hypothetical protein [Sulfitobacter sp. KE31]MDF3550037.1 hypothetical protein [Sulfitobacter sp. KE28]
MLDILRDFQAAIVGVIGFSGVIAAQLLNGRLARQREVHSEERRRQAVLSALIAELSIWRDAFERPDPSDLPKPGQKAFVHTFQRIATLDLMKEMGLLRPDILEESLYALLTTDSVKDNAALFAEEVTQTHLVFCREAWPKYATQVNSVAKKLDKCIQNLRLEQSRIRR